MKAILEFNLPDDQEEFDRCVKATDMAQYLWQILLNDKKNLMRQLEADNETTEHEYELINKIWEHLHNTANEYGINIEKLLS
jgi:hypothetical protein